MPLNLLTFFLLNVYIYRCDEVQFYFDWNIWNQLYNKYPLHFVYHNLYYWTLSTSWFVIVRDAPIYVQWLKTIPFLWKIFVSFSISDIFTKNPRTLQRKQAPSSSLCECCYCWLYVLCVRKVVICLLLYIRLSQSNVNA